MSHAGLGTTASLLTVLNPLDSVQQVITAVREVSLQPNHKWSKVTMLQWELLHPSHVRTVLMELDQDRPLVLTAQPVNTAKESIS